MMKIIACIVGLFILTGCADHHFMSTIECDSELRNKYTNGVVTRLVIVGDQADYYPKWMVKTADNQILFVQRNDGMLLEQRIF